MPGNTIHLAAVVIEYPCKGMFAAARQHLPGVFQCEFFLMMRGHTNQIERAKLYKSPSRLAGFGIVNRQIIYTVPSYRRVGRRRWPGLYMSKNRNILLLHMILRFFQRYKHIVLYGFAMALLLLGLKWLEWRFLVLDYAMELYSGALAVLFTG